MKLVAGSLQIELAPMRRVDDEDWVRVQAVVATNGFAGDFEAWLQLGDVRRFQVEVEAMYAAVGKPVTASLHGAEPGIDVLLEMQVLGRITGRYRFESERPSGHSTTLAGAFEMDQSYLPGLSASLATLIVELS